LVQWLLLSFLVAERVADMRAVSIVVGEPIVRNFLIPIGVLVGASLAFAQSPQRATSADLRITLSAVKSPILVGEFAKVKADWQFLRQIRILFRREYLQIDDGSGYRDHLEGSGSDPTVARAVETMSAGETRVTELVIGLEALQPLGGLSAEEMNASIAFAFPHPGTYSVKMRYDDVESNPVTIQVVAPSGADASVLAAVRAHMGVLTEYAGLGDVRDRSQALLSIYAGHRYLAPMIRELNGGDRYLGINQQTLDRRSAFDFSETSFAADEALWRARVGGELFGETYARAALQNVVLLYPGREAAILAAEELMVLDSQPPDISVTASPSELWPPNDKMIAVLVFVSVRDGLDQSPVVVLESITCDDNCSPSQDIQQAAFGTNDIEFLLRSKRSGGGTGRLYTITYRASNAAGNTTTAETTVLVPHNRGK
jgi:hypothetical protein